MLYSKTPALGKLYTVRDKTARAGIYRRKTIRFTQSEAFMSCSWTVGECSVFRLSAGAFLSKVTLL
jgi:hypothetical protein